MKKNFIRIGLALLIVIGGWFGVRAWRAAELNKMVGQMILVGFRGTGPGDEDVQSLVHDIRSGNIGGVILFSVDVEKGLATGLPMPEVRKLTKSRNITDINQVRELNELLSGAARAGRNPPLFISVDQEGGTDLSIAVVRLVPDHGFDLVMENAKGLAVKYPPTKITETKSEVVTKNNNGTREKALKEEINYEMTDAMRGVEEEYYELGLRLRELGFNVDFAPVVDVDINPTSPAIGARGRAFSNNGILVAAYGRAAADGLARAGVIYSFKHFPGHGSAGTDTHDGMTDITDTWDAEELLPYKLHAQTDMPGMVMVAHVFNKNFDEEFPASLSEKTIGGILRRDIGYDGVVISDDLQMGAIYKHYGLRETLRLAILAGNDIMLLGNNLEYTRDLGRVAHAEIVDMVRRGEIPRARIKESYKRIMKLKKNLK